MLLTKEDLKELWFKCKAYLLKQPSIDRINNDGNYEVSNCRFIEMPANAARSEAEKTHCKYGHPLSGEHIFILKDGRRVCRVCNKRRVREFYERKRSGTTSIEQMGRGR